MSRYFKRGLFKEQLRRYTEFAFVNFDNMLETFSDHLVDGEILEFRMSDEDCVVLILTDSGSSVVCHINTDEFLDWYEVIKYGKS